LIKLNCDFLKNFISQHEYDLISLQVKAAHELLNKDKNYTGWLNLPEDFNKQEEIKKILKVSEKIQDNSDILIVIGIGGSYLGAKAGIDFLKSANYNNLKKKTPDIYFVGNNLSSLYIKEILNLCENKNVSLNVISKSGNTLEPALNFRIFKEFLENKYGLKESRDRIFCTTSKSHGSLRKLADLKKYTTFTIPEDIGGRFSVLTSVGLLPMAVAGIDILKILSGAEKARKNFLNFNNNLKENICYKYAAIRNILYKKNKIIEIIASFEPRFFTFNEWFKQLFGESEGKDNKGIFPASAIFTTDLHSLGQLIQSGSRNIFETVIQVENYKENQDIIIKENSENLDNLNFLNNKKMSYINNIALKGTVSAHSEGGVPVIVLKIPEISEETLGHLFYFFEKACAISSYLLGVNPFDQPGVEKYKKNIFSLLDF